MICIISGQTCIRYFPQAACQPAVFRLLAVVHDLELNVPSGTSAKHMLALCSTYYYDLLVLVVDSDL